MTELFTNQNNLEYKQDTRIEQHFKNFQFEANTMDRIKRENYRWRVNTI